MPALLLEYDKFIEMIGDKNPVLFLDYDGTLTPIVKHPEDAILSFEMQEVLRSCTEKFTVAAVSGRDLKPLQQNIH